MNGHERKATLPKRLAKRGPPVTCSIIVPMNATTRTALAKSRRDPKLNLSPRFRVKGDTNTARATRWSQRYGIGGLGKRNHWKGIGRLGKLLPPKTSVFGLITKRPKVATYMNVASVRLPRTRKLINATFSAPPRKSSPPNFSVPADPGMKA